MAKITVLGLCGSSRGDSWNLKLLRNFLSSLDPAVFVTRLSPSLDLPLMNEDLERKELDARILELRRAIEETAIIAVASPEYNGSLSPALKNAIDWASRPPSNLWQGKIAVLLAASPGNLGGARGLIHLRSVLAGIKTWVIPEQVQCPLADHAFDSEGRLTNEAVRRQMAGAADSLSAFAGKLLS